MGFLREAWPGVPKGPDVLLAPGAVRRRLRRCKGTTYPFTNASLLLLLIFVPLVFLSGCTRRFYRLSADCEVSEVRHEKDRDPLWGLHNYFVYPNSVARFADPTNPDRPPMPPDDPAAWYLAPRPQRPKQVAYIEGTG